jgi:hypothetical protein
MYGTCLLTLCDAGLGCGRVMRHGDARGSLPRQVLSMPVILAVIRAGKLGDHVAVLGADT